MWAIVSVGLVLHTVLDILSWKLWKRKQGLILTFVTEVMPLRDRVKCPENLEKGNGTVLIQKRDTDISHLIMVIETRNSVTK